MHHTESIKKLFQDNSFIKEPLSPKKILEKVQEESTKIEAMKNILVRHQEGEDMDPFFNDVIKIIDTRNPQLKKLTNLYLKRYTKGNTIRQLLCVNTFLKDLSDKSKAIKSASLEVIGFMGDEIVLNNYLNKLKKMEDDKEIQIDLINCLVRFPTSLFPGEVVKGFVYSTNPLLSTQALACLSTNNSSFMENEELLELLKLKEKESFALSFVMKMIYNRRKTIQIDISTLLKILRIDSLPLFYFTATLLLYLDSNYKQLVYDTSLLYMKAPPESLYHLLLFQEFLLNAVSYSNSNYLLYEKDPLFIKQQKLKILFYRLDNLSIGEIKRCKELRLEILKYSLKKNIVLQSIPKLDCLNILFEYFPFSTTFTYLVSSYLLDLQIDNFNNLQLRKFLFLAGNCCSTIPSCLELIESKDTLGFDILKFYVLFYKRGILSEEELKEHLKKQKKNKEKVKFVLEVLKRGESKSLFDFGESLMKVEEKKREVKLYLGGKDGGKDGDGVHENETVQRGVQENETVHEQHGILNCKPYEKGLQLVSLNPTTLQYPTGEWLTTNSSGDVLVDTKYLKGTLLLLKDSIVLEVDVLESPQTIFYGYEKKSKIIEKEETLKLEDLSLEKVNKNYSLIVSNRVFEIYVDYKRLINFIQCSEEEFSIAFEKLSNYKLVSSIPQEFRISNSFTFEILGFRVYGKVLGGQVLLKGEREVLGLF